jgi:predicted nucleotidyltransferase
MSGKVKDILAELRRRLAALYGDRLVRIVLFGSQARGDAGADSDIDVMLVLEGAVDSETERERVIPITAELSLANDVVITCLYLSEERYRRDQSSLLMNVREQGVAV